MSRERDQRGRFIVRPKGAGRPKGVPNKRTLAVEEILEQTGVNPIEVLAWLAKGDAKALNLGDKKNVPLDIRLWAAKELAQYAYPKKRSIEVKAELEHKGGVMIVPGLAPTEEAWLTAMQASVPHEKQE